MLVAGAVVLALGGCAERPAPAPVPGSLAVLISASTPTGTALRATAVCSAVVLGPNTVATARHCLTGRTAASLDVVVGPVDLCDPDAATRRFRILGAHGSDGDVEVLTVDAELGQLGREIVGPPVVDAPVQAWGWGSQTRTGALSCNPRNRSLRVVECDAAGLEASYSASLCAEPDGGTGGVCGGDSGGPVFDEQGQGLIAIVSASRGCGEDQVAVLAPLTGSSDLQGA